MLNCEGLNPAHLFLRAATVTRTSCSRCSAWTVLMRSLTSLINLKIFCILSICGILHLSTLSFSKDRFSAKMQKWLNFCASRQVAQGWRKISKSVLVQPRRSRSRKESGVTNRQSSMLSLAWVDPVMFPTELNMYQPESTLLEHNHLHGWSHQEHLLSYEACDQDSTHAGLHVVSFPSPPWSRCRHVRQLETGSPGGQLGFPGGAEAPGGLSLLSLDEPRKGIKPIAWHCWISITSLRFCSSATCARQKVAAL